MRYVAQCIQNPDTRSYLLLWSDESVTWSTEPAVPAHVWPNGTVFVWNAAENEWQELVEQPPPDPPDEAQATGPTQRMLARALVPGDVIEYGQNKRKVKVAGDPHPTDDGKLISVQLINGVDYLVSVDEFVNVLEPVPYKEREKVLARRSLDAVRRDT